MLQHCNEVSVSECAGILLCAVVCNEGCVSECASILLCAVAAGNTTFSLLRSPDEFLGNVDSMDTSDGKM